MRIHIITLALIALDQLFKVISTKIQASYVLKSNFLHIRPPIHNSGISFGLQIIPMPVLIILSLLAIAAIIHYTYTSNAPADKAIQILLIAGSVSNLIDRIFRNHVIDMLYVSFYNHTLFICNFADILITIGFILALYKSYKGK